MQKNKIKIVEHVDDLPMELEANSVSIDTETMGLHIFSNRLCIIQLCVDQTDTCHIIHVSHTPKPAKNLKKLLVNNNIQKIFHYARFDLAMLYKVYKVNIRNIFCTKIASKLARPYTDKHGLKRLCWDLLSIEISKEQQSSDWGNETLTPSQKQYAVQDVAHLVELRDILINMLKRENRFDIAQKCFDFLMPRIKLDFLGWEQKDIFDFM